MLFEENHINSLLLSNRIIRSATWEGLATPEGKPTDAMVRLYENLAGGGVGLIMTGFTCVHASGKPFPNSLHLDSDECIESFKGLIKRVHAGGAKIGVQLSHGGAHSRPRLIGKEKIKVPSLPKSPKRLDLYNILTIDDIRQLVNAFTYAAYRAKEAGFDLVQIQAGHGYLINQFLSPLTNGRIDHYGGCLENRARFLYEVYDSVRNALGDDYPITVKINAADMIADGLSFEDSIFVAKELCVRGINAIEVSGGYQEDSDISPVRKGICTVEDEGYFRDFAFQIKSAIKDIPVIAIGGIRSYEIAENILRSLSADYVALSRPLICEPDLPSRWRAGDKRKSDCISCNQCFMPGLQGKGIQCMIKNKG